MPALLKVDSSLPPVEALPSLPVDKLQELFVKVVGVTAEHFLYLAAIWQALIEKGVRVHDLRNGIVRYLPRIVDRSLLPSVVAKYHLNDRLMKIISRLSLEDQRLGGGGGRKNPSPRQGRPSKPLGP